MELHINDISKGQFSIIKIIKDFDAVSLSNHVRILERLKIKLENQYIRLMGITSIIEKEYDENDAQDALAEVRKTADSVRENYNLLESEDFFNNSSLKEISLKILDATYNLEFIVRKKAFKNKKPAGISPETEITARLQLQALQSL